MEEDFQARISPQVIRTDAENTTDGERLLEGKIVNLKLMEKEDLPIVAEWLSTLDFYGEYNPLMHVSRADLRARIPDDNRKSTRFKKPVVKNLTRAKY